MKAKVSIILPIHKVHEFVDESINSVINLFIYKNPLLSTYIIISLSKIIKSIIISSLKDLKINLNQ